MSFSLQRDWKKMNSDQRAVVEQTPDEDHPAQVIFDNLDYEFASVFKILFPDIQCGHCFAQMRLLFIAGILTSESVIDALGTIRKTEAQEQAAAWWAAQVEEARVELKVELKTAAAVEAGHFHHDESARNH
jgi:hypothetical protein